MKFTFLTHCSTTLCLFHRMYGGPMHIPDMLGALVSKVGPSLRFQSMHSWTNHHEFGFPDIFDLIATHEGHKTIRDPVEKLYSKISSHEPQILSCAQRFCNRLSQESDANRPLNLSHACLSLAIGMANRIWNVRIFWKVYTNGMSRCSDHCNISTSFWLLRRPEIQWKFVRW